MAVKYIFCFLLCLIGKDMQPLCAQNKDAVIVYCNDGTSQAFLRHAIDSIVCSKEYQDVWNLGKNERIEVRVVDSVAFVAYYAHLSCPDDRHPHAIDLGLPSGTLWACCNVGANAPQEFGGYYAWGETEEKEEYSWATYTFYSPDNDSYANLGSDICGTARDVAHQLWGDAWQMPSEEQCAELVANSTGEWAKLGDAYGRFIMGRNGGSIFIPAAGYRWFGYRNHAFSHVCCWSGTAYSQYAGAAHGLGFYQGKQSWTGYDYRYFGQSVRAVAE